MQAPARPGPPQTCGSKYERGSKRRVQREHPGANPAPMALPAALDPICPPTTAHPTQTPGPEIAAMGPLRRAEGNAQQRRAWTRSQRRNRPRSRKCDNTHFMGQAACRKLQNDQLETLGSTHPGKRRIAKPNSLWHSSIDRKLTAKRTRHPARKSVCARQLGVVSGARAEMEARS